jgi:hypothetical protein
LLIVNERHLRQVLTEYLRHYNTTRPHRSLGQLKPTATRQMQSTLAEHRIGRKQVLGGLTTSATSQPYHSALLRETQVTA